MNNQNEFTPKQALILAAVLIVLLLFGMSCSTVKKATVKTSATTDSSRLVVKDTTSLKKTEETTHYISLSDLGLTIDYSPVDTTVATEYTKENFDSVGVGFEFHSEIPALIRSVSGNRRPTRVTITIGKYTDSTGSKKTIDSNSVTTKDTTHVSKVITTETKTVSRKHTPLVITLLFIGGGLALLLFLFYKFRNKLSFIKI